MHGLLRAVANIRVKKEPYPLIAKRASENWATLKVGLGRSLFKVRGGSVEKQVVVPISIHPPKKKKKKKKKKKNTRPIG